MSSKLKPNNNSKKSQKGASRTRFWTIVLCVGVLLVATVLILFKLGVFDSSSPEDVAGIYHLTYITDPATGVSTPVEQMTSAMEMVGPGEPLISIELKADGTFSFDPHFDMMVRFTGTYTLDGKNISLIAKDDTSGPITGTIGSRTMTLADLEGYKMTFEKVR